jgi:hypothetical protein
MDCPICLNKMENKFIITTPCKHKYCLKCLLKMKNTICAICRYDYYEKLPKFLKSYFSNKKEIQAINIRTIPDLNDQYEFPPL